MHPSSKSDNSVSCVQCSLFTLHRHRKGEKELGRVREGSPNYEPVNPAMCPLPTQDINFVVCGISELYSGCSYSGSLNSSLRVKQSVAVMSTFLPLRPGLGCWPAVGVGDRGFGIGREMTLCGVQLSQEGSPTSLPTDLPATPGKLVFPSRQDCYF